MQCERCRDGEKAFWHQINGTPLLPGQVSYLLRQRNPDGSLKLWAKWALEPVDLEKRPCPVCGKLGRE